MKISLAKSNSEQTPLEVHENFTVVPAGFISMDTVLATGVQSLGRSLQ